MLRMCHCTVGNSYVKGWDVWQLLVPELVVRVLCCWVVEIVVAWSGPKQLHTSQQERGPHCTCAYMHFDASDCSAIRWKIVQPHRKDPAPFWLEHPWVMDLVKMLEKLPVQNQTHSPGKHRTVLSPEFSTSTAMTWVVPPWRRPTLMWWLPNP